MSRKSHKVTVALLKQIWRLNAWAGKLEERLTTEELKKMDDYGKKSTKPLKLALCKFKFEHLEKSFDVKEIGFGGAEWDLQEEFWYRSPQLGL